MIKNANVTLILPDGYKSGKCFVGRILSEREEKFLEDTNGDGRTVLTLENMQLGYNEGVTFNLNFEDGALTTYFDFTPYWFVIIAGVLLVVLVLVKFLFFNKNGITPYVNFDTPKKLTRL